MNNEKRYSWVVSTVNILFISFTALTFVQLSHEGTHALSALLLGSNVEKFHLQGVLHQWPEPLIDHQSKDLFISGSAAIVNILTAVICLFLFKIKRLVKHSNLRLFIFYVAIFSWLMGFGYLFIDPIIASSTTLGDWAKIIMFFGGGLLIRLPLFLVGSAGVVTSYFLFGRTAMRFSLSGIDSKPQRVRTGILIFIVPYVALNVVYSVFGFFHPLGITGLIIELLKGWLGFSGLVWAFLIVFIWSSYKGPYANMSIIGSNRISSMWFFTALFALLFSIFLLAENIR